MFESIIGSTLTLNAVIFCTLVSLGLGFVIALVYAFKNEYNKNIFVTLLLTPIVIQAIIMMVNGSIGTGVAVMGAFGLIRFRSTPGSFKDILYIFVTMAVGIATGIGQVYFAIIFAVIVCVILIFIKFIPMMNKDEINIKQLRITVAEDLDFEFEFKDILEQYASAYSIERIKTSNMGSLFVIFYKVRFKSALTEREFINQLRIKNGNLPIILQNYKIIYENE